MCWNAPVSLVAFLVGVMVTTCILGMAIVHHRYNLATFCAGWYLVVAMQLLEYFIWRHPDNHRAASWAYLLNVLQIAVIYVCFTAVQGIYHVPWYLSCIASAWIVSYVVMVKQFTSQQPWGSVMVNTTTPHLVYPWWTYRKGGLYLVYFITMFLLLARPWPWTLATLAVLLGIFLITFVFFHRYVASMWCFGVLLVPLLMYALPLY